MLSRLVVLLGVGLLCLLPVPALAAPSQPCVLTICPTDEPTTPPPTHTASPTPTRTSTPQPSGTRTSTTRPTATRTPSPRRSSSDLPVTPLPTGTPGPFSSLSPIKVTPAKKSSDKDSKANQLVALVLGGAVLLGIGGLSGLYLTRERDEL